jgi:hypothetical protein
VEFEWYSNRSNLKLCWWVRAPRDWTISCANLPVAAGLGLVGLAGAFVRHWQDIVADQFDVTKEPSRNKSCYHSIHTTSQGLQILRRYMQSTYAYVIHRNYQRERTVFELFQMGYHRHNLVKPWRPNRRPVSLKSCCFTPRRCLKWLSRFPTATGPS